MVAFGVHMGKIYCDMDRRCDVLTDIDRRDDVLTADGQERWYMYNWLTSGHKL